MPSSAVCQLRGMGSAQSLSPDSPGPSGGPRGPAFHKLPGRQAPGRGCLLLSCLACSALFAWSQTARAGHATIAFDDPNPPALVAGHGAEVKPDGAPDSEWTWHQSFTGKQTRLSLAPGKWNIRVFAVSADGGVSDPSNSITVTILAAPLNLHVVPAGASVEVSPDLIHWQEVATGDRLFVRFTQ